MRFILLRKMYLFILSVFFFFIGSTYCFPRNREQIPVAAPGNFTLVDIVDDQAKVEWDPVPEETVRGQFQGYAVRLWNHDKSLEYAVPNHVTTLMIDFFPYSKNFITVAARNNKFVGPLSDTIAFDAPQTAPRTPIRFDIRQIGSHSLFLNWSRPEENGILLGYRIICHEILDNYKLKEEVEATNQVNSPDKYTAKVTGLKTGHRYRLTLHAANCVGESLGRHQEIEIKAHEPSVPSIPDFRVKVNYTEKRILQECAKERDFKDTTFVTTTTTPTPDDFDFVEVKAIKKITYQTTLQNCLVDCLITWLPDMSGNPGEYFYVKYRAKGEQEFQKTEPEMSQDFTIIKDYNSCRGHEIIVTSVDGNYTTDSDVKEVPRYKYGYM